MKLKIKVPQTIKEYTPLSVGVLSAVGGLGFVMYHASTLTSTVMVAGSVAPVDAIGETTSVIIDGMTYTLAVVPAALLSKALFAIIAGGVVVYVSYLLYKSLKKSLDV